MKQILRSLNNTKAKIDNTQRQKIAAIYARTSGGNQKFNFSIGEQVSSCLRRCEELNWQPQFIFVDEGRSAQSIDREKFQRLLETARDKRFDILMAWKLDRIARSLCDLVNLEREFRKLDIGIYSVTENIDTVSSLGRFNFRNLASYAELEREMIGERSRMGLFALAKQHKWPNAQPPLGFDRRKDGKLRPNHEEVNLVNKILHIYLKTKSLPGTAFQLNEEGLKTKNGKEWNARAVRDVLINEIYIGKFRAAGFEDFVKEYQIVNLRLFKRVACIRTRYHQGKAKRPPMPRNIKMLKIEKIFSQYNKLLAEPEKPSPSMLLP